MQPEVSLPCSQQPAIGPYRQTVAVSLLLPILFP